MLPAPPSASGRRPDPGARRSPAQSAAASAAAAGSARELAWLAWDRLDSGASERIDDALDQMPGDARERALARELVAGCMRHLRLYDALSDRYLRPGPQPAALRRGLRLALHQIFSLDRIPAHAAVDATLDTMRRHGGERVVGVANAVLRTLLGLRLPERAQPGPLGRLPPAAWPRSPAVRHSLPDAFLADLGRSGLQADDALLAALNLVPHLCTRSRPGVPPLTGRGILRQEGPWTWWSDAQEALEGPVRDGRCTVQDRSQGLVAELCRVQPGDLVLDCCAAPGGKSVALAELGGRVVAGDSNRLRLPRLRANCLGRAALLCQDVRQPALAGGFDLVLVDAPCSNSGVWGRRPEARWRYDEPHLTALSTLQQELLRSASQLVAPGGRLCYATCSIAPRENQAIAHRLPGWRVLGESSTWPDAWQGGGYAALMVRGGAEAKAGIASPA
jgi:16S rRNA (cytosine967-C5)-methyltransferase